jgi:hypothetical protein
MKKILSIVCLALFLGAGLVGCGSSSTTAPSGGGGGGSSPGKTASPAKSG